MHLLAALAVLLGGPLLASQDVPPPESTPVEMIVSGRTSTLGSITVESVGQNIPQTFSKDRLKNAPGFTWFVSRHYALQTDYNADRARYLLTLLELAYPHYVECFGREIPGIDTTRMAVIYGASTASLKSAMETDGINWDFGGGGIAYEGINAAYNYPSGTLQYHQRYIMLHECAHLYQICLNGTTMTTPPWYYEGVADAVAHHVWESAPQRLTMAVVDKPTVNNWYDAGLAGYAREPFKAGDILRGTRGGRDVGFLLYTYFSSDPSRLMRFRIWRDELFRLNLYGKHQDDSARLIEELFGSATLDEDFDAWLRARRSSFHYVDWGWEQDGDAMMSYGYPQTGAYSQTDLLFAPGDTPRYDPLVMDYPLHPRSALVGPVERGVPEPTVGCLVGLNETPDSGVAGMALGVEGRSFVKVLVAERKRLLVDGTDLGAGQVSADFTGAFRDASANTLQIGITVRIAKDGLEVSARTGEGDSVQTITLSLPLTAPQRERLISRPMAVLSRDGRHWVTPYIDDARRSEPDLSIAAPPNRWRFAMMNELYALERAVWRLGPSAPASLNALRDRVLAAARSDAQPQAAAALNYADVLTGVEADIRSCAAPQPARDAALVELRRP